ncbi:MAG: (2Fe-2S)-binding protein [Burkholderiaceae bacterium]
MIVCICHRVSDRDIAREVKAGCRDFGDLQDELRVATACGACTDCARQTFDGQVRAQCAAAPARSFPIVTHRPAFAA